MSQCLTTHFPFVLRCFVLTVQHFTYGAMNPIAAYVMAFIGSLVGLTATARARSSTGRASKARWLASAAIMIGGGIWIMHFIAMVGFDVPASSVRYDPYLTALSALIAIVVVGVGLFIAGTGKRSMPKILAGGVFTGVGVAAMHYAGMAAMRLNGIIVYDRTIVGASVLIAVVASSVALWFTVTVRTWVPILGAAAIMGVAVCGMHYTGMAAVHVHAVSHYVPVAGLQPIMLIPPITLAACAALIGLLFSTLQATTDDGRLPANLKALPAPGLPAFAAEATGVNPARLVTPVRTEMPVRHTLQSRWPAGTRAER